MDDQQAALENMHQLLLEALRHREQDVLRYMAILVPAIGGVLWLLQSANIDAFVFAVGVCSAILLLLVGSVYSLALDYNYRYITLQLAKLETMLNMGRYMLQGWPTAPEEFEERYRVWGWPWCTPPEVVKIYWCAFTIGIAGTVIVASVHRPEPVVLSLVISCGGIACLISLAAPWHFGRKLAKQAREERGKWYVEKVGDARQESG